MTTKGRQLFQFLVNYFKCFAWLSKMRAERIWQLGGGSNLSRGEARLQWAEEQMRREELVGTEFRVWKEGKEGKMLPLSLGSKILRTDSILDGEKSKGIYIY